MASFSLHVEDLLPNGTTVSALKHANYAISQRPPTSNIGTVDATATVTSGVATFTGLADDTSYFATATVSGNFRVVSFRTPAVVQAQTYSGTQDFSGSTVVLPDVKRTALTSDLAAISAQTTLQNTGLSWPIGASTTEQWAFQLLLIVAAANSTMDIKLGVSLPANAAGYWGTTIGNNNPASLGALPIGTAASAVSPLSATLSYGTFTGTTGMLIFGVLIGGGTAGTVQLQYAQNTSDAGNLQILRGSQVIATRGAS